MDHLRTYFSRHGSSALAVFCLLFVTLHTPPAQAASELNDAFGTAITSGDFDGDGYVDVAIGIPGQKVGALSNAGTVKIFYGFDRDSYPSPASIISQDASTVPDSSESDDRFGQTLTAGDFNGDGIADLVIGAPFEDLNWLSGPYGQPQFNHGAVTVIYGARPFGLLGTNNSPAAQFGTTGSPGGGAAPPEGRFGTSLAVGDFNCDHIDDLAIGSISDINGGNGSVTVFYGTRANGLTIAFADRLHLEALTQQTNPGASFGASLASGNFNGDCFSDLAIGIPNMSVNGVASAGAVAVLRGSSSGPEYTGGRIWSQAAVFDGVAIAGKEEAGDQFGFSVAAGDFDGDGLDDLAVGVPYEDIEGTTTITNAGAVNIIYSSSYGLGLTPYGNRVLDQASSGIHGEPENNDNFGYSLAAGRFTDAARLTDLAIGTPGESIGAVKAAGAVNVVYGVLGSGLNGSRTQILSQSNLSGAPETDNRFGTSLAVNTYRNETSGGSIKRDLVVDLLVGVPFENIGTNSNAGMVHYVPGYAPAGLSTGNSFTFHD